MTAPPTVIGNRYRLRRPLGAGVGGHVWEVDDLLQGGIAALKFLDPNTLPAGRPWLEAEIMTGLRGERILGIRNAEIYAGAGVLVTEVAPGGTVEDQITEVGVYWPLALRWLRQACVGVQRIHDVGLIHCDIKPANLFLDDNQDILVGDLGIATLIPPIGPSHNFNSPQTVAPEVAAARRIERISGVPQPGRNSIASDVYSLGAVGYWLLTGQPRHPPPAGGTWEDWLQTIATSAPIAIADLAPHVPQDVRQRITRAMAPDPADRYASPAEFSQALGSVSRRLRIWFRTDEHPSHALCYRSTKPGAADVVTCVVPIPNTNKVEIISMRGQNRVRAACYSPLPARQTHIAQRLRTVMRAIG